MATADLDDIDLNEGISVPSAPTGVEVADFEATSAKIKWKPAPKNETAFVNGYLIEYKDTGDEEWSEYLDKVKPNKYPTAEINDLTTGAKYEFRVIAVSRAGKSEPSQPTQPQVIKAQKAPPKIDRRVFGEECVVKCKMNQQCCLDIPVEGAPSPDITWILENGEELRNDDNVKVSKAPNLTKLLFVKAKRANCGKYTIKAKNNYGEDSLQFVLQVQGKPASPGGPLVVSDVTRRTCLVSWSPSQDDGGHPIETYEVEKFDLNTEQWLPAGKTKGTSLEVKSLAEGKSYKFLVRAVNKEGDSPDLVTEEVVVAKNPFDPPDAPDRPEVCDFGPDFVDLRWNTPERDGGAEITSYRIEVRNRDRRGWNVAGNSTESDAVVNENIEVGNEYEFRIVAVNKAGESEPSKTSQSVLAKSRFVKPKISREGLQGEKSAYASQTVRMKAEVLGEPKPVVSWWSPNGAKLETNEDESGGECRIEETENGSNVTLTNVSTKHSGLYKVKAKNSEGSDEVEFQLTVIGPPSKPVGPLEVVDVSKDSCRLTWKRCEQDGGSPIKAYVMEKKDVERDHWVSCGQIGGKSAVVLRDFELTVNNLIEGQVYVFRVAAVNSQGESEPLEALEPICACSSNPPPLKPAAPVVVEQDKKWVRLEWKVPSGEDISHFIVEKQEQFLVPKVVEEEEAQMTAAAEDEGAGNEDAVRPPLKRGTSYFSGEFQEYCSKWMVAETTAGREDWIKITDLGEGHKYKFRLKAVNAGGQSDPSQPSEEVVCRAKQRPIIDRKSTEAISVAKGENMVLSVKFSGDPIPARTWHYGKVQIKPSSSVMIEDKDHNSKLTVMNARPDDAGQYEFKVENEFGQETVLIDVVVRGRPSKPKGPMKIFNVTGDGCECSWGEPEDDGGSPVIYYIVEKQIPNSSSFSPCVKSKTTSARLTGLNTGKEYKLQVRAVNGEGESDPLPGIDAFLTENPFGVSTAPGIPEMVDGDVDYFVMAWDPPRNDGGTRITGYELEARKWKDTVYFPAGEVKMQIQKGEVTGVELGQSYAVRVRAINAAGASQWSMDSEQLTVKHRALKPTIVLNEGAKELIIKEGKRIVVTAEITAEPPAKEVSFSLGNNALMDDPNRGIKVDTKSHKSRLEISPAERRLHRGTLKCEAHNLHGRAEANIEIVVQSAPSKPRGILEVFDIHKTGCKLRWEASQDDGGSHQQQLEYVVEKCSHEGWSKTASTSATAIEINDLEAGKEYLFRVKAVNGIGESEELTALKPIVAKEQFGVPLPPGAPEITDWSERFINIAWAEPLDCGGAPIHAYQIEARLNLTGGWQLWETSDGQSTSASIQMLNKGTEYQFRVRAVNKAGKSEPSHPSKAKIAQAKNVPPSIDTRYLRDVKAVAGERVKFDLPYEGVPEPDVVWTKIAVDGSVEKTILSNKGEAVSVTTTPERTKLAFNDVSKKQEGRYELTVSNSNGKETASVLVIVMDRPLPPEGLTASSSASGPESGDAPSSCSLFWKKSNDDGGSPIEYYQIERLEDGKADWLACGRTKDNTFEARGLLPGRRYRFRVSAVNKFGYSDLAETKEPMIIGGGEREQERVEATGRGT